MNRAIQLLVCLFLTLLGSSINQAQPSYTIGNVPLSKESGKLDSIKSYCTSSPYAVIVFLSPDCPICQYYMGEFPKIRQELDSLSIPFIQIFCGAIKEGELFRFKKRYGSFSTLLMDEHYTLATLLKATIYPEIFLVDIQANRVVYHGKIDDRFPSLGVRNTIVRESYFTDALHSLLKGAVVHPAFVPAVGCFLEIPE